MYCKTYPPITVSQPCRPPSWNASTGLDGDWIPFSLPWLVERPSLLWDEEDRPHDAASFSVVEACMGRKEGRINASNLGHIQAF
jgi:hypothetical protein